MRAEDYLHEVQAQDLLLYGDSLDAIVVNLLKEADGLDIAVDLKDMSSHVLALVQEQIRWGCDAQLLKELLLLLPESQSN